MTRAKLNLPGLPRKIDPRRAKGYKGYRGSGAPIPWWGWLTVGLGLLVLMALEWRLCLTFPAVSGLFRKVASGLSRVLSFFTGLLPVPVCEWALVGLVIGWLVFFIRKALRRDWAAFARGACKLCAMFCAMAFLFVALYGVHHTAPSLAGQLGLTVETYSVQQLIDLTAATAGWVNDLAPRVQRDSDGKCDFGSFRQIDRQIGHAYTALAEDYAYFDRPRAGSVKKSLLGGRVMSYVDLAGFYCPWTAESVVSSDVVDSHIPFDIAHESAHSMGIGPENECNFAAWLACIRSDRTEIQYSGWLCAFVYASNSLYAADHEAWLQLRTSLCEQANFDLQVLSDSLARFEDTKINELGSKANDALIKATGQQEGLRSYGKMVDLMLAYFSTEIE